MHAIKCPRSYLCACDVQGQSLTPESKQLLADAAASSAAAAATGRIEAELPKLEDTLVRETAKLGQQSSSILAEAMRMRSLSVEEANASDQERLASMREVRRLQAEQWAREEEAIQRRARERQQELDTFRALGEEVVANVLAANPNAASAPPPVAPPTPAAPLPPVSELLGQVWLPRTSLAHSLTNLCT